MPSKHHCTTPTHTKHKIVVWMLITLHHTTPQNRSFVQAVLWITIQFDIFYYCYHNNVNNNQCRFVFFILKIIYLFNLNSKCNCNLSISKFNEKKSLSLIATFCLIYLSRLYSWKWFVKKTEGEKNTKRKMTKKTKRRRRRRKTKRRRQNQWKNEDSNLITSVKL